MKHDMRTLLLLLILGFLSEARKPRSERRPPNATPGREKRSPFGYVVRGPNHVAAFQMGSLDDGLLGHFPRFSSSGFGRGGAFVANSLSNFFNNLVDPSPSRSLGKPRQQVQTQRPPGGAPLLFSQQGPELGKKDAPVFPQGNVIVPRFGTVPPPPRTVHVPPPVNLAPSIRSPASSNRQSTQYFVLGETAPEVTDLYNHPALPTVNPLHPFSRSFHNYPTIVTLGHSNPGVLPTLNPSRAFPTLNPPFYTNNFATFAVSQIEPTRTFLQPTFAPLPPSPPLAPPLPPPSFPPVVRAPVPRPVTTLPKGTFFWFKLNNENFTFSPNYNEFMKSYQNPLFFTRPMQNSFFRPFFTSGNRAFLYPSVNRVSTTNRLPDYVPNYFPAHFPLNIPFLKAEDEHPAEGHPGKHTTIYHGPAGGPTPTPTVGVTESTLTSDAGTEQTSNPDDTTPESSLDTTPSPENDGDSSPVTESDEDAAVSSDSGREIDESDEVTKPPGEETVDSFTESPESSNPDETKEPAYKGFVPATEAPSKPSVPEADDEDGQTREPTATVIPFDTSTSSDRDVPSRPRSFDQSSNDGDSSERETTTKSSDVDFDDDVSAVRRTGKSPRDSNDYEQLFVDFMSNPNSIDGAGKPESDLSTTVKTGLEEPTETTTTTTTTTTAATTTTPSTTTVRFDEFDHFVDIFAPEKPVQEETTTSVTSEAPTVTTASTTTELEPETTTAPKTTTTTTAKPKFKLTTKFRPRLTSARTTTAKPKARPTIKFKSRSTTVRTKVKITEPTTAKPPTTTTEATTTTTEATTTTTETTTTTTEVATTTTEVATTTTETISAGTDSIATVDAATTEPATVSPTEAMEVGTTQEGENREEATEKTSIDEGTTSFSDPVVTPEREELPTTMAMEEIPATTAEPSSTESTAEITTVQASDMSTATTEATITTTQSSLSEDPPDKTTMGSDDETTTARPQAMETDKDAPLPQSNIHDHNHDQTSTIATTTETAPAPDEPAATTETQTSAPATEESSPTTPNGSDSSVPTTVPESETSSESARKSTVAEEVPTTAAPPEADDSRKEAGQDDDSSTKGQVADDGEATTASTESAASVTSENPRMNNRKSKKLEDDDGTSPSPTSATPVDESSSTDTGSSTDEIAEETSSPTTTSEEPNEVATGETSTATDPTEPTTEEISESTTSETANSTDSGVTPPDSDREERRERIPETVLVGGRNYSDVQDNHPVVTDIETSENNKKVRRAATWFVWLLDREKIAKNLVNDVSDFAASRNIIYVVTAALLISLMLSLMGLYCTLRSKK